MANHCSAELEMTINMLIQIDKLVQLLESPVFTCKQILLKIILTYQTDGLLQTSAFSSSNPKNTLISTNAYTAS